MRQNGIWESVRFLFFFNPKPQVGFSKPKIVFLFLLRQSENVFLKKRSAAHIKQNTMLNK